MIRAQSIEPKKRLIAWLTLSRLPFHAVGVLPFILGMVIAWRQGYPFNWGVGILSILAVILIMLTTYYAGEYYDYETDSLNREYNKFSGGTRGLFTGVVPRHHALIASYICLALAITIGLIIQFYYKTGAYTIPLGAFGILCGFFYTGKPFQWAYRGIGELLIGPCYGWLTVNTAYYLQVSHFDLVPTLISIPIGISIFLVILINEFPDYISDGISGKRNLVVRFGRERMALLYSWLLVACYISMVCGYLYHAPRMAVLLSPLALVLIVWNILAIRKKGYENGRTLEGLCARTILLNLLIAGIYILAFVLGG